MDSEFMAALLLSLKNVQVQWYRIKQGPMKGMECIPSASCDEFISALLKSIWKGDVVYSPVGLSPELDFRSFQESNYGV